MNNASLTLQQAAFINGQWQPSAGASFSSENPADGSSLWQGNAATAADIDDAVAAARAALPGWRALSVAQRNEVVERFVAVLQAHEDGLAEAIHEETGKPLWESRTEVGTMKAKAGISLKAYHDRTGSQHSDNNGVAVALDHAPVGVLVVLGPYNFPGHLPNGHIIPALLAGNTVVFKPSEFTPRFGELMVQCWAEAGLPAGVINLVQGGAETGRLLSAHDGINGLLFTGSSTTGRAIHRQFGGQPEKMLALEMGGNNPLVVEQVSDPAAAVYTIIQSAFISAGQRCTCARRLILVRNSGNEALLDKLVEASARIRVGSGDDCFMGPVINNTAADRVMAFAEDLIAAGGQALLAPRRPDASRPLVHPGIIDVTSAGSVSDEECFGPLLQVRWADSLDEAIDVANATSYGLSAGLLSDNATSWQQFRSQARAGIINCNRPITGASGSAPFGGVGASGNYRPGAYYAADYSAYPIASMSSDSVELPEKLAPGITL